jgi:hypothetical protein
MSLVVVAATNSFDGCGGEDSLKKRCDVEGAKGVEGIGCIAVSFLVVAGGKRKKRGECQHSRSVVRVERLFFQVINWAANLFSPDCMILVVLGRPADSENKHSFISYVFTTTNLYDTTV